MVPLPSAFTNSPLMNRPVCNVIFPLKVLDLISRVYVPDISIIGVRPVVEELGCGLVVMELDQHYIGTTTVLVVKTVSRR